MTALPYSLAGSNQQFTLPSLDARRWNALVSGQLGDLDPFIIAVRTTGIYYRLGCPARRPNRENVRFYDTTAAAREAGFRACTRCHPDTTA